MTPTDIVVIIIIALLIGGASFYIIRAKKRGQKCIGCPDADAKTCSGNCASCQICSAKKKQ